jgi:hypothetical protein
MHVKCIVNYANYYNEFPYMCNIYYDIYMFYVVLGDFINNPISSGSNYVWQKTPLFSVFAFPRAT